MTSEKPDDSVIMNNDDPDMALEEEEEKNDDNVNDVRYQNSNISLNNSTDILDNQSQSASQSSVELNNKTISLPTKRNQPDDDLTSLTWLHQQNLLEGLELPAKVEKNGDVTSNNSNDTNNNSNKNADDDDDKDSDNDNNNNNNDDGNSENDCGGSSELSGKSNFIITPDESCYSGSKTDGLSQKKNKNHSAAIKNHRNQTQIDQRMEKNSLLPSNRMKISLNYNNNNMPITNRNKHPTHIPYDPYLHRNSKPPYSFSCLIFMAIEDSPIKALPVKEVYAWILDHFPYFRTAQAGWKNSVRHNLSLNKCFRKVDKAPNMGKGSLWKVDNQHRSNLLQALARAPFPRPTAQNSSSHDITYKKNNATRLPDPVLFPYLFKKLASNNICSQDFEFDSDVDAAAVAMLSFRHGPIILNHDKHRRQKQGHEQEKLVPVITRSSNEDHTYSCITSGVEKLDSKNSGISRVEEKSVDELRKVAEGADALLNLASIALSHNNVSNNNNNNNNDNNNNNNISLRLNHEQSTTATNLSSSQHALPTKSAAPKKSKRRMISKIYMNLPDVKRNKHWPNWRNSNRYLKQVKS